MERTMSFIVEQQAQTATKLDRLVDTVASLSHKVDRIADKVDRTAGSITNLLAVAEIQASEIKDIGESIRALAERQRESEERGRRTDERLDALINIVERHVGEGRNGKA